MPCATNRQSILDRLRVCHRQSLDRSKFWNRYSEYELASTESRSYSRQQRELEAEWRERIKSLRRALMKPGMRPAAGPDLERLAVAVTGLLLESSTRTTTLRRWASSVTPAPPSDWLRLSEKRTPSSSSAKTA